MTQTLLSVFPAPKDLLALTPEDLGGVILEIAPGVIQNGMFNTEGLLAQLYQPFAQSYPQGTNHAVTLALAEALSWLVTQGLIIHAPRQPAIWYVITRRGQTLKTRADVEVYRKSRILPEEFLQPALAAKIMPLFQRGDHDVAVFQAFKEIEVSVRRTSNFKGANYANDLVGVKLMRSAFNPEGGPLTDTSLVGGERQAEMELFSGAMGHAKNPPGHQDVNLQPQEAARLIIFASYLLSIIEKRAPAS